MSDPKEHDRYAKLRAGGPKEQDEYVVLKAGGLVALATDAARSALDLIGEGAVTPAMLETIDTCTRELSELITLLNAAKVPLRAQESL